MGGASWEECAAQAGPLLPGGTVQVLILPRENGGRGESSPGGAGRQERAGPGAPAGAATSQTLPGPGGPCGASPGQAEQGCPTGWQALWCRLRCQHGREECPRPRKNPTRLWKPWVEAEEPGGDTQGGGEERGRGSDSTGRSEEAVRQAKAAPYRQHLPPLLPRWLCCQPPLRVPVWGRAGRAGTGPRGALPHRSRPCFPAAWPVGSWCGAGLWPVSLGLAIPGLTSEAALGAARVTSLWLPVGRGRCSSLPPWRAWGWERPGWGVSRALFCPTPVATTGAQGAEGLAWSMISAGAARWGGMTSVPHLCSSERRWY